MTTASMPKKNRLHLHVFFEFLKDNFVQGLKLWLYDIVFENLGLYFVGLITSLLKPGW